MSGGQPIIDRLIVNKPYDKPERHWQQKDGRRFELVEERRPAGYLITDTRHNTNRFVPLELVERIRGRVEEWKAASYLGSTSVTRRLLEHWHDRSARDYPFYFCQLEAIETLIWWIEGAAAFKQGIEIPGDGGPWERLCNKMATGSGKTTVMAMTIAWQVLNALTYPHRKDFSRAIFIVTPGLTVKERLQVLYPSHENNYYDAFNILPSPAFRERLNEESSKKDEAYEERLRKIVQHSRLSGLKKNDFLALRKEELLRAIVDNVGKPGTPGQRMQNVISVAMLSEGWDAKNVTHILGLRAFTSQLLCEQVIGRGLRRTAYEMDEEGRFLPEYVNIFGVPFTFLPMEGNGEPLPPPKPKTAVESLADWSELEITWPNVLRIEEVLSPILVVDWATVERLEL